MDRLTETKYGCTFVVLTADDRRTMGRIYDGAQCNRASDDSDGHAAGVLDVANWLNCSLTLAGDTISYYGV